MTIFKTGRTEEGLTVVEIDGKLFCAACAMPIINKTAWKEIHFLFHKSHAWRNPIDINHDN